MPITVYKGQTFTNQSFIIEECYFSNCILQNCDLFYSGGDADWNNVKFENCLWHFRGPALKTMQTMQSIGMLKSPQMPDSPLVATGGKMN